MPSPKRKLQVFVSSTYTDLIEERQAAVQAILSAGHIPAGMELFAAGDKSQLEVIKKWIDESDVYMLILGGRYGSVEKGSGKSYTQIEYEYALKHKKPLFAVVISDACLDEKVKVHGRSVIETDHAVELKAFRKSVLSRMVRFWNDPRDITIAIHESISALSRREELIGWIPGNAAGDAVELARLTKENRRLRAELAEGNTVTYSGLTYQDMYALLARDTRDWPGESMETMQQIAALFGDEKPGMIHEFWASSEQLLSGKYAMNGPVPERLARYGFVHEINGDCHLTEDGKKFLMRLKLEHGSDEAQKHILPSDY